MATRTEFKEAFENEWYAVRYSGEIPEIALYSAFYYLSEDAEGPCRPLNQDQRRMLVEAAMQRFREIVLRDLQHENRGTSMYRGVRRSLANWKRYQGFCSRQGVDGDDLRSEVCSALRVFLTDEVTAVRKSGRPSCLDCTAAELVEFSDSIGLDLQVLYDDIFPLCRPLSASYPEDGP